MIERLSQAMRAQATLICNMFLQNEMKFYIHLVKKVVTTTKNLKPFLTLK